GYQGRPVGLCGSVGFPQLFVLLHISASFWPHEMLRISGATSVSRIPIPDKIMADSIWNWNYKSE
ncbi:MAG: hypothetical protein LBC63_02380, partial [Holophagales bacterium]|nr:hypothetical protein [Holophagales bacterium]